MGHALGMSVVNERFLAQTSNRTNTSVWVDDFVTYYYPDLYPDWTWTFTVQPYSFDGNGNIFGNWYTIIRLDSNSDGASPHFIWNGPWDALMNFNPAGHRQLPSAYDIVAVAWFGGYCPNLAAATWITQLFN
jgi:hypothetical protein